MDVRLDIQIYGYLIRRNNHSRMIGHQGATPCKVVKLCKLCSPCKSIWTPQRIDFRVCRLNQKRGARNNYIQVSMDTTGFYKTFLQFKSPRFLVLHNACDNVTVVVAYKGQYVVYTLFTQRDKKWERQYLD
jgi:hypothetical protein